MKEKPFSPAAERNSGPILEILTQVLGPSRKGNLLEIGSGTGQHAVSFAPHFPNLIWTTSDVMDKHEGIRLWLNQGLSNPDEDDLKKSDFGGDDLSEGDLGGDHFNEGGPNGDDSNGSYIGNIRGPLEIEIGKTPLPRRNFDVLYSANVLHIISWEKVQHLIQQLGVVEPSPDLDRDEPGCGSEYGSGSKSRTEPQSGSESGSRSESNSESELKSINNRQVLSMNAEVLFYGPFNKDGQFTSESNEAFDRFLKSQDPESGIRNLEAIEFLMKKQNFTLIEIFNMPSNNFILYFRREIIKKE